MSQTQTQNTARAKSMCESLMNAAPDIETLLSKKQFHLISRITTSSGKTVNLVAIPLEKQEEFSKRVIGCAYSVDYEGFRLGVFHVHDSVEFVESNHFISIPFET
jgi:hypothetical protein